MSCNGRKFRGRDKCMLVLLIWGLPKKRKIPALDAGFHPISLLHLHPTWNNLLPARGDGDLYELRNV